MDKPHIIIKNNAQKGGYKFSDILNANILSDVCMHMTGRNDYTITFDEVGYNRGRLAFIEYNGAVSYVSFSEHGNVEGRNSFFQALTTALISYSSDLRINKRMAFYFLPSISGNFDGAYFQFMYRLMATNDVEFLNADRFIKCSLSPFTTIEDLIATRSLNRSRNTSNNSTYITRNTKDIIEIYAKTYGASKKESTLLSLATSHLSRFVRLFEICEQDLTQLPAPDKKALEQMGNVEIISTNRTMERKALLESKQNFRSPTFVYNLLNKFQDKECAFCDCKIPEIIAGAHIWSVADIKRYDRFSKEEKLISATDGENGLWLCYNHHKMFDENLITITNKGKIVYKNGLNEDYKSFIKNATTKDSIPSFIFTDRFANYLKHRTKSMSA
jgi:hypothetical protein